MRIETEVKLDYKDVLLRPKRSTLSSRSDVDINREFEFLHSKRVWKGVPIIAANMDTIATVEVAKVLAKHELLTCLHKFYTNEQLIKMSAEKYFKNSIVTVGIKDQDIENIKELKKSIDLEFLCIDVANGYTERFIRFIEQARKILPTTTIIAGNVVTGEMTEQLILSGADIVKIGIGPGSACTTRLKAGVGYPQLSAVIECADAAHGLGGRIIADGGCTVPGDLAKAFGGGADFVMLGGMLAGHDENAGEIIEENGKKFKIYYGMSSTTAMVKHYGKRAAYRASEGKAIRVPYRGALENTIEDILGGLRSACTYIGARQLKHVPKCATFIRVTQQANEVFKDVVEN
ncbi:MAG: GMP reductase [Candidatus Dojkabacteria bacterium]|uniref:GMP reductase n=1 Tax=Candidatus Dojkabacteria bacterium TaxID=2099670 RepID=A0A952AID8_9BACT|nr:GMP reductase [Candidatus Dojkabacteria bacterium]WKZ27709.1 MAG: GMP reductase [Candidatus Dojkabacteria bacterium]